MGYVTGVLLCVAVIFGPLVAEDVSLGPEDQETLQCSPGTVIIPLAAYYGVPADADCEDETAIKTVIDLCFNNQQCTLDFRFFTEPCDDVNLPDVLLNISYACVESENIVDICNPPAVLSSSPIYLTSPNFPSDYPTNMDCELSVLPTIGDQLVLNFIFISMNRRSSGVGCYDYLNVLDPDGLITEERYCGTNINSRIGIYNNLPLEITLDKVDLTFYSDGRRNEPGFLLMIGEPELGPCYPDPCDHGQCSTVGDNAYECLCDGGYDGDICDVPVDECEGVECNNGDCAIVDNVVVCNCDDGWQGDVCDEEVDPCEGVNCNNGDCIADGDHAYCDCIDGWGGYLCDVPHPGSCEDHCVNGSCVNGNSSIHVNGDTAICECEEGWQGPSCDVGLDDDCYPYPCSEHTVKCEDDFEIFFCHCEDGWNGRLCEKSGCGVMFSFEHMVIVFASMWIVALFDRHDM